MYNLAHVLWLSNSRNFNGKQGAEIPDASSCQILSKSVKRLKRYCNFSIFQDGGRPPSWICFPHFWTTHEAHLVVFIGVQNFGWNPCSSFDNMKVWIFRAFGFKMPIHADKIGAFWRFDPLDGEVYQRNPKRHTLARKDVIWRIDRQNRSTGATCESDYN